MNSSVRVPDLGSPVWARIARLPVEQARGYILAPYRDGEPFAPDRFDGVIGGGQRVGRILDFGGGLGRNLSCLRGYCDELVMYDIEPMVAACRGLIDDPGIRLTSDWTEVTSGTYDLAVANFVLQHIESVDAFRHYISGLSRITDYLHVRGRHWRDGGGGDNVLRLILDMDCFRLRSIAPGRDAVLQSPTDGDLHFEALFRTCHRSLHRERNRQALDIPAPTAVQLGDFALLFDRQALRDRRGIGRVSSNLLAELQTLATAADGGSEDRPGIWFFSTIHSCPERLPSPCAVMIHDVIPLKYPYEFGAVAETWQTRLAAIARQADIVFTFSESSACDIEAFLGIDRSRIKVVPNGVRPLPDVDSGSLARPSAPYLVYIGTDEPHKNAGLLLDVLQRPEIGDYKLALCGYTGELRDRAVGLGLADRVTDYGRLSDEDLGYLLKGAHALLFPSLYEGFGLPPLEAGLLGVPSVCSDRAAMSEILDGAAELVDPNMPAVWSAAIVRLQDGELRRQRVAAMVRRARQHRFDMLARRVVDIVGPLALGVDPVSVTEAPAAAGQQAYRRFDPPLFLQAVEKYREDPLRAELFAGKDSSVLLFSTMAGKWRRAFSNWVGMAERFGYDYAILGRNQGYLKHYSKCRAAHDFLLGLPPDRLVCQLDSTDAFICAPPDTLQRRFLDHDADMVVGAERGPFPENSWDGGKPWSWSNTGLVIARAEHFVQVLGDILAPTRSNLELWDDYGHFCDQHAFNVHLLGGATGVGAHLNTSRDLVVNWDEASDGGIAQGTVPDTCALHFFGGQIAAYNRFARCLELERL